MTLVLSDHDFTLHHGDALEVLRTLPAESVHCVVTSPPYWGLRDYGTGSWDGGDPGCDHTQSPGAATGNKGAVVTVPYKDACGKCGASRVDHQLGLEPTPDAYVAAMVAVFREVRRVLRSDGTLWLNLGDSYSHGGNGSRDPIKWPKQSRNDHRVEHAKAAGDTKPKDLVGVPWKVAFALQADGWWLRSEIIWSKLNPMPESVTDRPTKAHEQVFLLAKSARYFFDQEAVREPHDTAWRRDKWTATSARVGEKTTGTGNGLSATSSLGNLANPAGRNVRTVWEIATQPYPDAHFATYPEELVRRCILAGCPEGGVVLDPFLGSGTTAKVARDHGRRTIGIELNADYCQLIARRTQQQTLLGATA